VKSLFTKYIRPVLALATLTMGAMLLSACGASVTEQASLPGTVTAVVSPSRVVAGQIYTYKADSASGSTVTWSWGDGSPDTVGNTVQKVWNKPGSFTTTVSAGAVNSSGSVKQGTVVSGEPVSAGADHTCALLPGGKVGCWGSNFYGQLGDGTRVDQTTTVAVSGLTDVVALSSGSIHTCALKSNGSVACWGDEGVFGFRDIAGNSKVSPVVIVGLTDAVALSAGDIHTCALKANGSVVCWGNNDNGQLGDGARATRPVSSTAGPGITRLAPSAAVIGLTDAVALSAGGDHTCALKATGKVVCWGSGALGNTTTTLSLSPVDVAGLPGAVALSAGLNHTCALKAGGSVACWGNNSNGQFGDGTLATQTATTVVSGLTDALAISAGDSHTCALKASGSTVCWGANQKGQSGSGASAQNLTTTAVVSGLTDTVAISAGASHTCALKNNAGLVCWGNDINGQLGDGNIGSPQNNLVTVIAPSGSTGLLTDTLQISTGANHSCVLNNDGKVLCWGDNSSGQLGNPATVGGPANYTPKAVVGLGTDTKQISTGSQHTCALKNDGQVLCWGVNQSGQLGKPILTVGTQANPTPTLVVDLGTDTKQISAGGIHTCALKNDGKVLCWGDNTFGEVGNPATLGGQANSTPTAVVGLGTDTKQISTGSTHACALKNDGKVLCWGLNANGQLGNPLTVFVQANPTPTVVVDLGTDTKQITTGNVYTCALKNDGKVLCWGDNTFGQLGNPATFGGRANPTPTAVVDLGIDSKQISAGGAHICALKNDGKVLCWGNNLSGQLGNTAITSTTQSNPIPTAVVGLDGANTQQIGAGTNHTCALKTNGKLLCWGSNGFSQLGAPGNPPAFVDLSIKPEPTPVLGGSIFWK
jgi:alpha-tubulin suppressor-like RCC1 family protein